MLFTTISSQTRGITPTRPIGSRKSREGIPSNSSAPPMCPFNLPMGRQLAGIHGSVSSIAWYPPSWEISRQTHSHTTARWMLMDQKLLAGILVYLVSWACSFHRQQDTINCMASYLYVCTCMCCGNKQGRPQSPEFSDISRASHDSGVCFFTSIWEEIFFFSVCYKSLKMDSYLQAARIRSDFQNSFCANLSSSCINLSMPEGHVRSRNTPSLTTFPGKPGVNRTITG